MGKIEGIFQFTGKVGQVVGMKGRDGRNYSRIMLKPVNPKTTGQTDQRVKMSLAGLMSKLTPASLIVGMASDKRTRRERFTANIARNAVVTTIDDQRAAKIDPALVLFSDGAAAQVNASDITVTSTAADITVETGNKMFEKDVVSLLIVAAFANANGQVVNISSVTLTANTLSGVIAAPTGYSRVNVYYIPVVMAEGTDNVTYQRVVNMLAQDASYQALATISATGSIVYRRSEYLSSYTPGA